MPDPKSDIALAERDREFALKREELDWKKETHRSAWTTPLVISVVAGTIALIGNLGKSLFDSHLARIDLNPLPLVVTEQGKFLEIMNQTDISVRNRILCEHQASGTFVTEGVVGRLDRLVTQNNLCRDINPEKAVEMGSKDTIPLRALCETPAFVVASCRAYDKSGFHSRPNGSCRLELEPGEGQVFDVSLTEFESKIVRNLAGLPVQEAIKPTFISGSERYASGYAGVISCTNSIGTGRTCEHTATVRAAQVPADCVTLTE